MGQAQSSKNPAKGDKKVIAAKLDAASKTGILNLANCGLKAGSSTISVLTEGALPTKLKSLDISENEFKTIPAELTALTRLKTLHVSRCNLQRTPDLTALNLLEHLTLAGNDLECATLGHIPTTVLKLNLSMNHFNTLPPALAPLILLTELNLKGNRIQSTSGLGMLVNLVHLTLDENLITVLSDDVAELSKLQHLSLRANRLGQKDALAAGDRQQQIPAAVFQLSSLIVLDLGGNEGLRVSTVMQWQGVDTFLEHRRRNKEKSLQGGAMIDHSVFGLD